jgi:hypothetical protein
VKLAEAFSRPDDERALANRQMLAFPAPAQAATVPVPRDQDGAEQRDQR